MDMTTTVLCTKAAKEFKKRQLWKEQFLKPVLSMFQRGPNISPWILRC